MKEKQFIEFKKAMRALFSERYNETNLDDPSTSTFKSFSEDISIDFRTLKNFYNGEPVSPGVINKIGEAFNAVILTLVPDNYHFTNFLLGSGFAGIIVDIKLEPNNIGISKYLNDMTLSLKKVRSTINEIFPNYPKDRLDQLTLLDKWQKEDLYGELSKRGVSIYSGILPSFMEMPSTNRVHSQYITKGKTKVLCMVIHASGHDVANKIKYVPDWDQVLLTFEPHC